MRFPLLVATILASSLVSLAWAQDPVRMPSAPAAGSPGTATPQPYGQPSTPDTIKRQGSAPLLPPPQGQTPLGARPKPSSDQPLPQLEEQLRRNRQGLDEQRKQD